MHRFGFWLVRTLVPLALLATVACTVAVQGSGTGSGTVLISEGNVVCTITAGVAGPSCTQEIDPGKTVTLTASPAGGSAFGGWSSDCDSIVANVCTITINRTNAYNPTVGFILGLTHLLTMAGSGTGNGSVRSSVASATCAFVAGVGSGTCQQTLAEGTSVQLTPTAATGSSFAGWTGCDSVASSVCTVALSANKTATARFDLITHVLTMAGTGSGNGSAQSSVASATCAFVAGVGSGTCQQTLAEGTSVQLTPTAATGSSFAGWTGCDSVAVSVCTVALSANKTATARFDLITHVLTMAGTGSGNGSAQSSVASATCAFVAGVGSGTCQQTLAEGTSVQLTPTAASGSSFAGWTGCDSVASNVCTVALSANKTATAGFDLLPNPQVTIFPSTIDHLTGAFVFVSYSGFVPGSATATLSLTGPGLCSAYAPITTPPFDIPPGSTSGSVPPFLVPPLSADYVGCTLTVQVVEGGREASASLSIS